MKVSFCRLSLIVTLTFFLASASYTTASDPSGELLRQPTDEKPKKFIASTKEESDKAIADAKAVAAKLADALSTKLETLETEHFLIFTDWDPREYNFLKTNMEKAYDAVAAEFNVSRKENVFAGKLPVYMFAKQGTFKEFSVKMTGKPVNDNVLGFFQGTRTGNGYMTMWKPAVKAKTGGVARAERNWGSTLVHEFTHAFLFRYRTNGQIPIWLNEGIADLIADRLFPQTWVHAYVRDLAQRQKKARVRDLLKGSTVFGGEDYPVAQTMVETLVAGSPKGFINLVNDIKDGSSFDDALRKYYKVDHEGFMVAWRKHVGLTK